MKSTLQKRSESLRHLITIRQYREAVTYLYQSRMFIYISIVLFFMTILIGYFFSSSFSFLDETIRKILLQTISLSGFDLTFFILQNNLQSSLYGLVLGILFGIFPLINLTINGILLGYVLARVAVVAGYGEFWRLLPHGIFELPAIIISLSLGLRLGLSLFEQHPLRTIKSRLYSSLNVFLYIVVPLLIIAAIIEGLLIALL